MTATHRPRKRFGQHFLTDPAVIDAVVHAIGPRPGETLVEIGPGRGAITAGLLAAGVTLHAVELDRDLAQELRSKYAGNDRFVLHEADALEFDCAALGKDLRLVGNLPYNISTPLLFHLLAALPAIRDMHFMLQKEVVERITSAAGSKRFGRLTVMLGCRLESEALFDVPPTAFRPPPKVTSSLLRLTPLDIPACPVADYEALAELVARAFSKRRKALHNALAGTVTDAEMEAVGIDPRLRPEAVPVRDWVRLANYLAERRGATR